MPQGNRSSYLALYSPGELEYKDITKLVCFVTFVQIKALHQYDCLRANKATSAWGLEARVPFLDKEFINVAMAIDPESKMVCKQVFFLKR